MGENGVSGEKIVPVFFMDTIDTKKISKKEEEEGALEAARQNKKETEMGRLFAASPTPPGIDSLIEGTVIGLDSKAVYADIPPYGTGIIFGREFINARDIIRKMNIGDSISAKVVSFDNKDGYIEISIKEARQALIWGEAEEAVRDGKVFELPITDANKGGLLISWQGITGFLPASQLKPEHYPRVQDGDKDKILEELKQLIGTKITVSIITALPREGKLIFSEKGMEEKGKGEMIEKYAVGDTLSGEITGVVEFGVFVKVEEGLEGLVHISEMDWGLVEDPKQMYKIGDKVKVKVIDVKDGKISLSIKQLKKNPWAEAAEKYKKDDIVNGVIIKFNKHGALASIEEGVAGLVHVSEFGSDETLRKTLELGKTYRFKINLFEPKEMKMTLSFADKEEDRK